MSRAAGGTTASTRLARLLGLVPWLLANPGVSVTEAAAHFGVTDEQLVADLDLLICSGPGQSHDQLIDIWYWDDGTIRVLDPQSLTRPLRLTAEEAAALLVGLRVLSQVPGQHDPGVVARVTARLEEAAGGAAAGEAAVAVELPTDADPVVLATVRDAVDRRRVLRIRYAGAARDQESVREVDPVTLLVLDGRTYLSGWCRSAGAMRTFRLDRVRSAEVLDEAASPPPDARGPELGRDGLRPEGQQVTLTLSPGARWVAEAYPVDSVSTGPDGAVEVTLPVADERWAVRLLLRLGADVRVVHPAGLAARVADEARAALAAYDA